MANWGTLKATGSAKYAKRIGFVRFRRRGGEVPKMNHAKGAATKLAQAFAKRLKFP